MDAELGTWLAGLLGTATLLPLLSFFLILIMGGKMGKGGVHAAHIAIGAIVGAGILSFISLFMWLDHHMPTAGHSEHTQPEEQHEEHAARPALHAPDASETESRTGNLSVDGRQTSSLVVRGQEPAEEEVDALGGHEEEHGHAVEKVAYTGIYYYLGKFGDLRLTISYYIDALTIVMFCMVTLIASCIHFYATGYMHDELHEFVDHEVTLEDGTHLHRRGRYHRFFQYLSLFCFSMLGLVVAGNVAMVFVFWELVGICSYFLIGFYVERKSASNAANKAFIVNRVGDFGMIIGLMVIWSGLGTFAFGDVAYEDGQTEAGIFSLVRPPEEGYQLRVPDGLVRLAAQEEIAELARALPEGATPEQLVEAVESRTDQWREQGYGYWLLIIAGLGIFCGCVGKSAQFPLHVWLPDAMEGPTPVSALVHSATMVAAGVYLVGRFYPVFAPEALLVIAVIGAITLFLAASIAITATDIKRVLAYSTVSQLGYMMLALGVGGWLAGMLHLVTHAFFKSLLFLCSGSVIHAVHTNEMTEMGGLWRKMPVTAVTMLIGCFAIAGAGIPFIVGLSGYYSKDMILEQAYSLMLANEGAWVGVFFLVAVGGAAVTAFYMFRLWYLTFWGEPRDHHRYDHAHESPKVMYVPLIILASLAIGVAWRPAEAVWVALGGVVLFGVLWLGGIFFGSAQQRGRRRTFGWLTIAFVLLIVFAAIWTQADVALADLLEQARPSGTAATVTGAMAAYVWPDEHFAHAPEQYATIVVPVTLLAFATAVGGFGLATVMYALRYLNPDEVRRQFRPVYRLLLNKWWFDELYDWMFVRPAHLVAGLASRFDRNWIDRFVDGTARVTKGFAVIWERAADQTIVDGLANLIARWTYGVGVSLRQVQTGQLRQYVMFIVIGAIAIFILVSFFWTPLATPVGSPGP